MKRLFLLFISIIIFFSLTACFSKPPLKLISTKVLITSDRNLLGAIGITQGPKKGQEIVPTALYYDFKIKNIGSYFSTQDPKKIQVKLVPKKALINASKETVGFNIFNSSDYENTGLGGGHSSSIQPNLRGNGEFTFTYELGVSEKNSQIKLMVPSIEKLKKLKDKSLNAYLVVTSNGKDIARFDLSKQK
jgi:hypothetical protein